MHPRTEHLPLLHAFSTLCQKAYRSWHLVASPVLAKVGLAELFWVYATGGDPPQPSKQFLLSKIAQYYVKAGINFTLLLCYKAAHILSAQRTTIPRKRTVLVDAYFLIPDFLRGNDVLEHYFPGIEHAITEAGWACVILPRFYGTRSPAQLYRVFRRLRTSEPPVITELQLMTWRDFLNLFIHLLLYPWLVLNLFKSIPRTREGQFVRFALADRLDDDSLIGAVRYLAARRLGPLLPEQARCLQWFENQTYERCLNRGLRETGVTMRIYGAQLFLWPPEILNIHIDNREAAVHKPDVILVNGPYYIHENIDIPCKTGSSMRYARLFETFVSPAGDKKTLVLLSWFEETARFTLELAIQAEPSERLMIKFHPAAPLSHLRVLIPPESVVIEGDIYDVFHETDLLIGAATGALVEAAAVGIPVIVIKKKGMVDYTDFPDIGRGLLWEEASSVKEIQTAKEKLLSVLLHREKERLAAIETLRRELFTRPTDSGIKEALDLLDGDHLSIQRLPANPGECFENRSRRCG